MTHTTEDWHQEVLKLNLFNIVVTEEKRWFGATGVDDSI